MRFRRQDVHARGTAIINLLQLMPGEKITAVIPLRKFEDGHYLMMATKNRPGKENTD